MTTLPADWCKTDSRWVLIERSVAHHDTITDQHIVDLRLGKQPVFPLVSEKPTGLAS